MLIRLWRHLKDAVMCKLLSHKYTVITAYWKKIGILSPNFCINFFRIHKKNLMRAYKYLYVDFSGGGGGAVSITPFCVWDTPKCPLKKNMMTARLV